ncbi:excalibur calcium-binding domain-containing protein [Corynebacterium mastitidis]|uniref:Excalibur calcium-binding domain-containing protein n=1 Tax=Corynebacterium mastitidis TaxID=161890 RepID=A0ABU8P0U5_9CORY
MSEQRKSPSRKDILVWGSVILGTIITLKGLFGGGFGTILIGIAIALPGAWTIYLTNRESDSPAPHWNRIFGASAVMFLIGLTASCASDDTEPTSDDTKPQTSVVKVTSEEVVTVTETVTEEAELEETPEEAAAEEPAEAQPEEEQAAQEEAPAPAQAAVPEPVQEAPVEAPASTYYANCSQAKAAGAAPLYAGSPGYSTDLDGDGDGVACEN